MSEYEKQADFFNAANETESRKLVSYFKNIGVEFIKVFNKIPRESYFALMNEAKKLKYPRSRTSSS